MGNQARVADGATVVSTSTRNFPNRLGTGANVFLDSAELAAVAALIGKLPTPEEYQTYVAQVDKTAVDTYRYLNFNQLSQYTEKADGIITSMARCDFGALPGAEEHTMDYEFLRDITGVVKVRMSMGHEVVGHLFNEDVK